MTMQQTTLETRPPYSQGHEVLGNKTMTHRLDPLLRPRSIAVLGATQRPGSVGRKTIENLLQGGFQGQLYAVNPGHDNVCGVPCFPDLASLPCPVEHVVFAVGDHHSEAALKDVIDHGAKAATIMSQLVIDGDREPLLLQRVKAMVDQSGLLVCGGNAMGFFNCHDSVWVCGFDTRENHRKGGNVTLISHSGAGMSGIVDCEQRIDFNLAVSTGQELSVGMHDYMDFAIEQHKPRVIGLFMETVRQPGAMIAVLEKAVQRKIPVVLIKVGRTRLSARLAASHSGAMAGSDSAYQALFDLYGVQRVDDMDEFTTALIMFAQPHRLGPGSLVSIHDSGGERQLTIDLAELMNVPLAELNIETTSRLEHLLDPGLPAVNPLDAWGAGGNDSNQVMEDCLSAMMADPAASMGAVIHDRGPMSSIYPEYIEYLRKGHGSSGKPVFLVANRQGSGADPLAVDVTREGFPVLDGLRSFLRGVKCLLAYRDFHHRTCAGTVRFDADLISQAVDILAGSIALDEAGSLAFLEDFGLPVSTSIICNSKGESLSAATAVGYPLVIKTAKQGIQHKTEVDGVVLDISDEATLEAAYDEMTARLGLRVSIAAYADLPGVEMVLGMVQDEQFGPLIMLGFGGVNVEILKDVAFALPPFDAAWAERLLDGLRQRPLLDRQRNGNRPDIESFCKTAARFSAMVAALADNIDEIDMNPVIVHADGCLVLDALVIGRNAGIQAAKQNVTERNIQ